MVGENDENGQKQITIMNNIIRKFEAFIGGDSMKDDNENNVEENWTKEEEKVMRDFGFKLDIQDKFFYSNKISNFEITKEKVSHR